MKILGFDLNDEKKLAFNKDVKEVYLTLSKKRKRGRPSKKDKEIFKTHIIKLD